MAAAPRDYEIRTIFRGMMHPAEDRHNAVIA
jgi:hypothetical protein